MKLKATTQTIYQVEYSDLDDFIKEVTGHDYTFLDEEVSNDSSHKYIVTGRLDSYLQDKWKKFKATGEGSYMMPCLLQGLCAEGHIEPGTYLVMVCW